ncbi:hypothetical protein ScPMuIL_010393 [Solemya velum]
MNIAWYYSIVHGGILKDSDVITNKNVLRDKNSRLITVIPDSVYFYSAIGILEETDNLYLNIMLIGWIEQSTTMPSLKCCLTYPDQNIVSTAGNIKIRKHYEYKYNQTITGAVVEIYCPISHQRNRPTTATLLPGEQTCDVNSTFLEIEYPVHHIGGLALCAQAIFNYFDPLRLIEWFEIQKLLGVDMVVMVTVEGLNKEAVDVLEYYRSTGYAHPYPYRTRQPSKSSGWDLVPSYISEQHAFNSYCWHTMKGYTYGSFLDIDEVIVPKNKGTLKNLMVELEKNQRTGSVTFDQKFFPMDSDSYPMSSGLTTFAKYRYATNPMRVAYKTMYITNRTAGVNGPHFSDNKKGFRRIWSRDTYFNHYRNCPVTTAEIKKRFEPICRIENLHYDGEILTYLPDVNAAIVKLRNERPDLFVTENTENTNNSRQKY